MQFKKTQPALYVGLAAAALGAASTAANAQTAATAQAAVGGGTVAGADVQPLVVTVTATRRAQGIQDAPVAVTAIGGDTLQSDQLRVINDITQYVPNFTGQSTEGRERPRWFLRGVGSNDPSTTSLSPVGFYSDDVYINSVFDQGTPLFDLQRIEVLRGPQGTLWGKNTIGGAINVISRKPDFNPGGYVTAGFGNHNSRLLEGAGGGPLVGDVLAGRISVHHEQSDSEVTNTATGHRFGGMRDDAVRGQLRLEASTDSDLLLNVHARRYRGGGNPWVVATQADRDSVSLNAPSSDKIDTAGATVTGNWSLANDLSLTSISAFEHVKRTLFGDDDYTAAELERSRTALGSDQWSQELRLASSAKARLSWIGGLHLFTERLGSDAETATLPGDAATAFQKTAFTQRTSSVAVFGSTTYKITPSFDLIGGLRWTGERKTLDINGYSTSGLTFSDIASWWTQSTDGLSHDLGRHRTDTWRQPTWDISPVYRLGSTAQVFGRVARGFRAGSYNTSALNDAAFRVVTPEYLTSYEAGLKSEWLDRSLILNVTAFHYDYKNIQVFALAPSSTGSGSVATLSNAGQGTSDGLEIELKDQVTANLGVFANVGLLRTRFDEFAYVPAAVGNSFARAPRRTLNIGGDYRIPLEAGLVTLHADANYRSREYFSATRQTNPVLWQNPYTLFNGHVDYEPSGGKYTFSAYVRNATDRTYKKLALIPSYGNSPILYGDGRTFGLTGTVRF